MKERGALAYTLSFFVVALIIALGVSALGLGFTSYLRSSESGAVPTLVENSKPTFVIDPGHGGEDPGAVAIDGTLEKDINLEISKLIFALCELNGNKAILTRNTDTLLYDYYDELEDYTGKKKVYDLKNRLKITEEQQNPIYVGIHLNKFQESKYDGLQVYYSSKIDESYSLATSISKRVKENLQLENKRKPKVANSSIFILDKLEGVGVLVECGFMSNEKELENLKNEEYRAKLALCIFSSLIEQN